MKYFSEQRTWIYMFPFYLPDYIRENYFHPGSGKNCNNYDAGTHASRTDTPLSYFLFPKEQVAKSNTDKNAASFDGNNVGNLDKADGIHLK